MRSVVIHRGLTATTWGNPRYRYIELCGLDDNERPIRLTLSNIRAKGEAEPLITLRELLTQLIEEEHTDA